MTSATVAPQNAAHAGKSGRCGPVRPSRRGRWRAAALIAVHLIVIAHVAHWKVAGTTVTPVEPSEAMQTVELGWINAGAIFFAVMILLTLVVGRFFCGWACHVVAYQDLCSWILGKLSLKPKPVRSRLLVWIPALAAFRMFAWPAVKRALDGVAAPPFVRHLATTDLWATFPGPVIGVLTCVVCGFLVVW